MKDFALIILLLFPISLAAEWNCDIKLIDTQTISITGTNLGKFKFTDEDNLTIFKKDGTKQVLALDDVDAITFSGVVNVTDVDASSNILFPNPSADVINIKGAAGLEYIIVNYSAAIVQTGEVPSDERIDVSGLESGDYILVLGNGSAFKLIKK